MKPSTSNTSATDRQFVAVFPPGQKALRIIERDLLPASWVPCITGTVSWNRAGAAWAATQSVEAIERRVLREMGLDEVFENSERERRSAWSAHPELAEEAIRAAQAERERLAELAEQAAFERTTARESRAKWVTPSPVTA